jgi:alkanesulfonate monooxygenase SsuD/methylene tetrahydromethanopterin reductase-like flavin-dependent oxidoreductase (luciferase family)
VARLFCAVTDDVAGARRAVKAAFAPYIATTVYNRYYRSLGYEEEAAGVAKAAADGDREAMVAAVSDRLVDEVFVLGVADAVAERLRAYGERGLTVAAIHPLAPDAEAAAAALQAIAERWEG